jgi:hypothetical protein
MAPGVTLLSGEMNPSEFTASHRMTPLQRSFHARTTSHVPCGSLLEAPAITGTTLLVDGGQHLQAQARDVHVPCPQQLQPTGCGRHPRIDAKPAQPPPA